MKILVLGGSYFYGRVFTMLSAKKHEITVLNRGTYSMGDLGVRQINEAVYLYQHCGCI